MALRRLTDEELQALHKKLQGTCTEVYAALATMDLENVVDPEEAEDQLLDVSLERCKGCGWWFEPGELIDENNEVVGCDQCRKDK